MKSTGQKNLVRVLLITTAFLAVVTKCLWSSTTNICTRELMLLRRQSECSWRVHDALYRTYEHASTIEERELVDVGKSARQFFDPICGRSNVTASGWVDNLRESGSCSACGSINRNRQLIKIMLHCASALLGFRVATLSQLAQTGLVIYNTQSSGAIHDYLSRVEGITYICSEYFPKAKPGELIDGIRHEDLQNLTLDSDSVDFVLSTEVLEHMPDPYRAHREIYRVLRPGGSHVFTVPFLQDRRKRRGIRQTRLISPIALVKA